MMTCTLFMQRSRRSSPPGTLKPNDSHMECGLGGNRLYVSGSANRSKTYRRQTYRSHTTTSGKSLEPRWHTWQVGDKYLVMTGLLRLLAAEMLSAPLVGVKYGPLVRGPSERAHCCPAIPRTPGSTNSVLGGGRERGWGS